MPEMKRVLLAIDDDPGDLELLRRQLQSVPEWSVDFLPYTNPSEGQAALQSHAIDAVFVDYRLGATTGLDVVSAIRSSGDERPLIVLTGQGDERIAAEIMRAGASDYLIKGETNGYVLRRAVENALTQHTLRQEKIMLEEELRQAQRLEGIGQLAGGLAHDFNNMLTSIMGNLELAQEKLQGHPAHTDIDQAQHTCKTMAELIIKLVRFSRPAEAEHTDVDLRTVIQEACVVLQHTRPNAIELRHEMPDIPVMVKGSASKLHQLVMNLAANACEAMTAGGRLTIRLATATLPDAATPKNPDIQPGRYALLEVEDTGCGIDDALLTRVFDPFFTTKELSGQRGTGLGLAIVWQHVQEHSGSVNVESEVGKGSIFRVYLPLYAQQPSAPERGSRRNRARKAPGGTETILLVDDEKAVLNVASRMLKRLGYTVYCAESGADALTTYQEKRDEIDAAILDISMPAMDGEECLRQLKAINPQLKAIFSSGHDLSAKMPELSALGAEGYIQKPYGMDDMAQRVRGLFDNQSG